MTTIADRLANAQHLIEQAAKNSSRHPTEISLLAVSKTKPIEDIIAAYSAGQRFFGENYVQEAQSKIIELSADYPDIQWHFIGPIQSNKTKTIAEHFDWVHTIDRDKIAKRLNQHRAELADAKLQPLNVCIQVNISNEPTKSGVSLEQIAPLAEIIEALPHLTLRGLMAIPTATDNTEITAQEFSALKQVYLDLQQTYSQLDTLSMGMSSDLSLAVEHGSTMVRIGTGIFGPRANKVN